jgi:hypothetical protein
MSQAKEDVVVVVVQERKEVTASMDANLLDGFYYSI